MARHYHLQHTLSNCNSIVIILFFNPHSLWNQPVQQRNTINRAHRRWQPILRRRIPLAGKLLATLIEGNANYYIFILLPSQVSIRLTHPQAGKGI